MTGFVDELEAEAKPIWSRIFTHPFLVEMAEGKLPIAKFRFYIGQDYAYLKEYCKALGMAVAKSSRVEEMRLFTTLIRASLIGEIELHKRLLPTINLTLAEVEAVEPAPTNRAYTSYLLEAASTGSLHEIAAAISPCPLTYVEIAERLMPSKGLDREPAYREWIALYDSKKSKELIGRVKTLLNKLGERASEEDKRKMKEHFLTASRYEYMFWDMAYRMESWPI